MHAKCLLSYVMVEYRADGDDRQHAKRKDAKDAKDAKDDCAGFAPLVHIVPPGFELRFARTTAAKKK